MKISGIVPFTTIDYPGALAAVLFCQGCAWRCEYCHNPHLQSCAKEGLIEWPHIVSFLKARQGFLEAIVLSGGEPTLQDDLIERVQEIRSFGYKVGLHTAGMKSDGLHSVLPFIDWIGMDIKAPFDQYEKITRIPNSGKAAKHSVEHILKSGVSYEFRTTVHPNLLSGSDLLQIGEELHGLGAKHYVLQPFRATGCQNTNLTIAYQNPWNDAIVEQLKQKFQTFSIRD